MPKGRPKKIIEKGTAKKVSKLNVLGLTEEETKKRVAEFEKLVKEAKTPEDLENYSFWVKHYKDALK